MESDKTDDNELAKMYGSQIEHQMKAEAERRINENHDEDELSRLRKLSLISLIRENDPDIVPALMARLGPVRAALEGHGGGLILSSWEFHGKNEARKSLSLVIDLDGACVSCGAAPGTLKGIQDDLLMDEEVGQVRFSSSMLEWFDEIQKEFVLKFGEVTFI